MEKFKLLWITLYKILNAHSKTQTFHRIIPQIITRWGDLGDQTDHPLILQTRKPKARDTMCLAQGQQTYAKKVKQISLLPIDGQNRPHCCE